MSVTGLFQTVLTANPQVLTCTKIASQKHSLLALIHAKVEREQKSSRHHLSYHERRAVKDLTHGREWDLSYIKVELRWLPTRVVNLTVSVTPRKLLNKCDLTP